MKFAFSICRGQIDEAVLGFRHSVRWWFCRHWREADGVDDTPAYSLEFAKVYAPVATPNKTDAGNGSIGVCRVCVHNLLAVA